MPSHHVIRRYVLLCFLFSLRGVWAQYEPVLVALGTPDSIQVTGYSDEPPLGVAILRADWLAVDGPAPSFTFISLGQQAELPPVALIELLVAGVDQYLDQRLEFTRNGVEHTMPVDGLAGGVDRLLAMASMHFGTPVVALSEATRRQLQRVCSIDWSQANFGVDGGDDQEKYMAIFYYVRAQRNELERNLRNDLSPLVGLRIQLGEPAPGTGAPGQPLQVPTVCTTVFDDENYLCALDLRLDSTMAVPDVHLTDDLLSDIALQAGRMEASAEQPRLRKRDRWLKTELDAINQRLDRIDQRKELWALRDRMDDLEGRVDDLSLHVDQLDRGGDEARQAENPVAGLSALTGKNLSVHFTLGSATLGAEEAALLNEVIRAMAQAPTGRVLLTGHADSSGDPARNLALSEQRAKSVRNYLLGHGISGERVLLNYTGSRYSTGAGAAERRVSLDWIR
ncbi:MAG: OmpA family protein [Flavobacteriales bacterium]|nr:OmpA family protein [Flavobacteriales bacterium]MBP9079231.1 OmpA family protein [Flavobacteriales bacterium]